MENSTNSSNKDWYGMADLLVRAMENNLPESSSVTYAILLDHREIFVAELAEQLPKIFDENMIEILIQNPFGQGMLIGIFTAMNMEEVELEFDDDLENLF